MTTKPNLAASVAARLLKRAKQTGDEYQTLLKSYCLERFLYRLGASDRCDVASGHSGYHFHRYHRVPGAHPLARRRILALPVAG